MQHPLPHAIVFDWDNTLVDSWPIIHHALCQTFIAMGEEPWTLDDVKAGRDGIHQSLRFSFPKIFGNRWEQAREVYYEHFIAQHLDYLTPLEQAEQVLKTIREHNVPMAIVSNKTGIHLRNEVKFLGWDHYFKTIIGATDCEEDKPSPIPLRAALQQLNVEPSEHVWMVGDSMTDVDTAINAGCTPFLFGEQLCPNTVQKERQLKATPTHHRNHQTILELFSSLAK